MTWLAKRIHAFNRSCIALVLVVIYVILFGIARLFVRTRHDGWYAADREPDPSSPY
jgi:hypothetical protein